MSLGFSYNHDKERTITATVKGNLAYMFLEALPKEKGILRIGGCRGNHKESIPFGWAK